MKLLRQDYIATVALHAIYMAAVFDDQHTINVEDIAVRLEAVTTSGQVRLALRKLAEDELIKIANNYQPGAGYQITSSGVAYIEERLSKADSFLTRFLAGKFAEQFGSSTLDVEEAIPASDRVVSRSDNSAAFAKIDDELGKLESELATNNEAVVNLGDAVETARTEISLLRSLVKSARIRIATLFAQARTSLPWIGKEAAVESIDQIIDGIFKMIGHLL